MKEKYHFIGIGGIGMSGLAKILLEKGISVSGSDIATSPVIEGLIKMGATVHKGHSADNITPDMTIVYSTDIKEDNPEFCAAKKLKCPFWHRSDMLNRLIKDQRSIAVAGTHGKTTTSALLSSVLIEAGWEPSIVVGGVLPQYKCNARLGKGEFIVFEADESDRTFLKYFSEGAIVTNIDNDHLNNYEGSEILLIESFKQFMSQVSNKDLLFWCSDDPHLVGLNMTGQRYGFGTNAKWRITNHRQVGFNSYFDLPGYSNIELGLIGHHNVLNGAAVFGLAVTLGVPEQAIRQAIKAFQGVLRRCEKKGEAKGIVFIDDYAHHPTEIETTLKGIRKAVDKKRMVVVFQPHRYTRTRDCLGMYGPIFESADEVIVTDIYAGGEEPIPSLHSDLIIDELAQGSTVSCRYVPRDMLGHHLSQMVKPDDVVVTLGAGDVTKVAGETLHLLNGVSG